MSAPTRGDVLRNLEEMEQLPDGEERLSLGREAVRMADVVGDGSLRFIARIWLVYAASFSGHPETALVEMSWCLGYHRQFPERFDGSTVEHTGLDHELDRFQGDVDLIWALKWVLASLTEFSTISREQTDAAFEQAIDLYRRAGFNLHAIHSLVAATSWDTGDFERAAEHRRLWRETPSDRSSDCPGCELDHEVEYRLREGDPEGAVAAARPLLSGEMRCWDGRRKMMSELLLPLVALGQTEEAVNAHLRGVRRDLASSHHVISAGWHIRFLAVTGNHAHAFEVARRKAPAALGRRDDLATLRFLAAWRDALELARERGGPESFPGSLPARFDGLRRGSDGYGVAALEADLRERVDALCAAFDARNGNRAVTERFEERARITRELDVPRLIGSWPG